MLDPALGRDAQREASEKARDDIHEITLNDDFEETEEELPARERERHSCHYIERISDDLDEIHLEEEYGEPEPAVEPEREAKEEEWIPEKPTDSYQPMMGNRLALPFPDGGSFGQTEEEKRGRPGQGASGDGHAA